MVDVKSISVLILDSLVRLPWHSILINLKSLLLIVWVSPAAKQLQSRLIKRSLVQIG